MAKKIKFNLICDDKPIRTIEDLQNNFSVEDVLTYYDNGLLCRWLDVRGYQKELEKVSAITSTDSIEVIKKLISIFDVESDDKKIEGCIYMLKYSKERKELCAIYKQENSQVQAVIDDYVEGYRQLVTGILKNPRDIAVIKANLAEIVRNYKWIFQIDHRNLFYKLRENSKLGIMCLLMNEQCRKYFLPNSSYTKYEFLMNDKKNMYRQICELIRTSEFKTELAEHLHRFAGLTAGYWKDLEPKGKKCMIISIERGNYVRASGELNGDMGYEKINNNFVIIDGIDYKSNNASHELLYMEV